MAITKNRKMEIVKNSYYLYVAFMLLDFIHENCITMKLANASFNVAFATQTIGKTLALVVMWFCFRSLLDKSERYLRNCSLLLIIGEIAGSGVELWYTSKAKLLENWTADTASDSSVFIMFICLLLAMLALFITFIMGIRLFRSNHGELRVLGKALIISFMLEIITAVAEEVGTTVLGTDSLGITIIKILNSVATTAALLYVVYMLRRACIWLQRR